MSSDLLEAKISVPALRSVQIERERLLHRLAAADGKLVVLHAAAGYGKTALLTQYAQKQPACAWYHLDEADNDGDVFWHYLSATLQKAEPSFYVALRDSALFQAHHQDLHFLVRDFVNGLCAAAELSGQRLELVLDNFQVIGNSVIQEFLAELVNYVPASAFRLFLATRTGDHAAFYYRGLLTGTAEVIRPGELNFTDEEANALLRLSLDSKSGERVPPETLALAKKLWAKAEGWPAGIVFANLYLRRRSASAAVDETTAVRRELIDHYINYEIYEKIPADVRAFLVGVSALDSFDAALGNAALQSDESAAHLQFLEQAELFITRIADTEPGEPVYRCQPLFREFLATRLNAESRREILLRAAEYFKQISHPEQTVEYAMLAADWERMQEAMAIIGPEILEQGKLPLVQRWIQTLERVNVDWTPQIWHLAGTYYYREGQPQKARRCLNEAADLFLSSGNEPGYIDCLLSKARIVRHQESLEASCALIETILPRLDERNSDLWYTVVGERMYNFIFQGRYTEVLAVCSEMILNARRIGNRQAEGLFVRFSIIVYFYLGKYARGLKLYRDLQAKQWVESDESGRFSVEAYVALMEFFSGKRESAFALIREELERKNRTRQQEDLWLVYLIQAYMYHTAARADGAERDPRKSRQEAERSIRMAEQYTADFRENHLFTRGVQIVQEQILLPDTKTALATARRLLQEEAAIAPLAREMGLSMLLERLYTDGALAEAATCAELLLEGREWEDAFSAEARLVLAVTERRASGEVSSEHEEKLNRYSQENALDWQYMPEKIRWDAWLVLGLSDAGAGKNRTVVNCFGTFRVFPPGASAPLKWRTRKAQELFAYLFHLQGQPVEKDQLLYHLWPEADTKSATSLLHTTLYSIRKELAPYQLEDLIVYKQGRYALHMEGLYSDRGEMDRLCRALTDGEESFIFARREVLRRCRGEYLGGLAGDICPGEGFFYEKNALALCRLVAGQTRRAGAYEEAADFLRLALESDPYAEDLYQEILQCYAALGAVKEAKRTYRQFTRILQEDLGIAPSPELQAAYRDCLNEGNRIPAVVV